jgi:hypothetical protein
MREEGPIRIKVTTSDPKRNYYVHFDPDTHSVVHVMECKTLWDKARGRVSGRTLEVVEAARRGIIGKPARVKMKTEGELQ